MNSIDDKPSIAITEIRRLSQPRPARSILYVLVVAAGIVVAITSAIRLPSIPVTALAFIVVGALQHHLSIIQHEAVHYLLFASRRWNEIVGSLCSWPIGFTMAYRSVHLTHHGWLGEIQDPDLPNYEKNPITGSYLAGVLFRTLSGWAAASQFVRQSLGNAGPKRQRGTRLHESPLMVAMTQLALLSLFAAVGAWPYYFLLWLFPLLTVTKALTTLRNLAEHLTLEGDTTRYRTIRCGWIEQFLFAPMYFNFHAEHHLFPSVTFSHLPELHRLLNVDPYYRRHVSVTNGYLATIWAATREGRRTRMAAEPVESQRRGGCMDVEAYAIESAIEASHWWFVGRRRLFADLLAHSGLLKSSRILEVGVGSGANLRLLRDQGFEHIEGVDLSPRAVELCQSKGFSHVVQGDLRALPFSDESYDLLIATDILEHLRDDYAAMKEIERVLRPGGIALITAPAFQFLWSDHDVVADHQRRYTRDRLLDVARDAGLTAREAYFFNFILLVPIALARGLITLLKLPAKNPNKVNTRWLNWVLTRVFALDIWLAQRWKPAFGVSILLLAEKPLPATAAVRPAA